MDKREKTGEIDYDLVISQVKPQNRELARAMKAASVQPPETIPNTAPETAVPTVAEHETGRDKETPREESKRRRGKPQTDPQDYLALFIQESAITARSGKTVYICGEHHDRLTKILQVVGKNEVSMFSYIYNVLEHHFSAYQDEINSLYANNLAPKVF